MLTVPTATSSRSGLHARHDTGLGRLLLQATGRFESALQTATDLKMKRDHSGEVKRSGSRGALWDGYVRRRCFFLGIV